MNEPSPEFEHDEFPLLNVKRLDFSQFHPLDHRPFGRECAQWHGGGLLHLEYAWEFRRRDQVLAPWHWLKCKTGHHTVVDGWQRGEDGEMHAASWCAYCDPRA